MTGLILAAGSGTRLGDEVCKPLVKIAGRHLIEYSLENLFGMGVERICIVVGKYGNEIESRIGSSYNGIPVFYVEQKSPAGLVNAIACALDIVEGDTVLQLSDEVFIGSNASKIAKLWDNGHTDFVCGVTREDNPAAIMGNYSVEVDNIGSLISCTEKPRVVTNSLKGTGFCIFSAECMKILKKVYDRESNTPAELCDFINLLIKKNMRGAIAIAAAKEYNINTAQDADAAKAELEKKAVEK